MGLRTVRILGWLVMVHAVLHAMFSVGGSLEPTGTGDWLPFVLYVAATLGFFFAGLGLLGVPLLQQAISPLLVLAAGLSLIAIVRAGGGSLWIGAVGDVALLVLGVWRAHGGWPSPHRRLSRRASTWAAKMWL